MATINQAQALSGSAPVYQRSHKNFSYVIYLIGVTEGNGGRLGGSRIQAHDGKRIYACLSLLYIVACSGACAGQERHQPGRSATLAASILMVRLPICIYLRNRAHITYRTVIQTTRNQLSALVISTNAVDNKFGLRPLQPNFTCNGTGRRLTPHFTPTAVSTYSTSCARIANRLRSGRSGGPESTVPIAARVRMLLYSCDDDDKLHSSRHRGARCSSAGVRAKWKGRGVTASAGSGLGGTATLETLLAVVSCGSRVGVCM